MAYCQPNTFFLIVFFTFVSCPVAYGADDVSLAINEIPDILEESKPEGEYALLLFKLQQMSSFDLKPTFLPISRAGKMFDEHKVDCLFPSSLNVYGSKGEAIQSLALNTAHAYLISLKPFEMDALLMLQKPRYRIAYRRGNTYGGTLNRLEHHSLVAVNDDMQSFGLLRNGRVDHVLTYMPDALVLLKAEPETPFYYDRQRPFYSQNDSIVCHDKPELRRFIDELNMHILQLTESGELQTLLGEIRFVP
ncbi:hypothetical protein [Aliiglaciecola litoralis]|uniref:Solute-binding protein family 3/N-terminal domain-containing protein n=1 Tax=Aliiglaciecola litoralis TaxID=582857 RepID=A0ABP3WZQ6_9ALTE